MARTIKQLFPGTTIALEYNGKLEDWIVTNDSDARRVIILKKVLLPSKRMHSSNVSVYTDCEMDKYLDNEDTGYLAGFDLATRMCLTATEIQTYTYGDAESHAIARRCFIPSEYNLFGNNSIETEKWWLRALMEEANTDNANTARIALNMNGAAQNWWLRSSSNASQFRVVNGSGAALSNGASSSNCVRPALSVSADTIVSDEGAEIVRLLPDPDKTYREVSLSGIAGDCTNRPKKVRVIFDAHNLFDVSVQVSNNAGDANPVWVNVSSGVTVVLDNTSKETEKWKVGVKMYGKSNDIGYFHEPIVLIEEG